MIAAPFLFIDFLSHGTGHQFEFTWLSGVFSLIYMMGWVCSIVGLMRLKATGNSKLGKAILWIQLMLLFVANIWNLWVIVQPGANSTLFRILDLFWPVSNAFMIVVAIATLKAKKLMGWRRYAPLFVALWLPVGLMLAGVVFGHSILSIVITGLHSTLGWVLLGYSISTPYSTNIDLRELREAFESNKKYMIAIN